MSLATSLLWRHIGGRPSINRAVADILFPQGQPEIRHKWLAALVKQDVAGLDVSMHNFLLVGMVQRLGHRRYQFHDFVQRQTGLLEPGEKVGSVDVLRDDEARKLLGTADIVNGNNVRMIEVGDGASLGEIGFGIAGLGDQPGVRHLDGNKTLQLPIVSQVNEAEAALAKSLLHQVATDLLRNCVRIMKIRRGFLTIRRWIGCCVRIVHGHTVQEPDSRVVSQEVSYSSLVGSARSNLHQYSGFKAPTPAPSGYTTHRRFHRIPFFQDVAMRPFGLIAVVLLIAADARDDAAKKDLGKFQGNWQLISAERDGKKTPQEEVKKITLSIQGNKFVLRKDTVIISEGTMTLDPTKKPREIDETITTGPTKGKVFSAIYEIDDEHHKICFAVAGKERPTAFSSGSGQLLQVWKREK
jgi:uncharacterized protein (TIGR03067 family)